MSKGNKIATQEKNFGPIAFVPMCIFLIVYLGSGVYFSAIGAENPFKLISKEIALIIAVVVGIFMGKRSYSEKTSSFARHCADSGVMLMCFIFILAGTFSGITKEMGGVESTVNLGLTFIPPQFIVAGLFLICVFISTAMGTCLGTISAIAPVAIGFAEAAGLDMAITMSAVIGGSMFGDNLSFISDTTIAATRNAGCEMRDKFKMNVKIAAPAALVTIIIYSIIGKGTAVTGVYEYDLIKVVPYIVVLVCALIGFDVIQVLISGAVLSTLIGLFTGSLTIVSAAQAATTGISGMLSLMLMAIFLKGLTGLATDMGGTDWLISLFNNSIKSRKGAQYAIAGITSIIDFFIGNNTVAIIISAPLAKPIAKKFGVAPQRLASLLDIFACIIPGISPMSSAVLMVVTMTSLSPFDLIKHAYYLIFLGIFTIITIQFDLLKTKEEKAGMAFYPELDEVEVKA